MEEQTQYTDSEFTEALFEKLFKTHFKGLCFFAFQYIKDYDISKEIVQDSFIGLWEKRDNIDVLKSVKSYLTTTIKNKSLNYLRDNKKFDHNLLEFENLLPESVYQREDKLVTKELSEQINEAIEALPEKCKEVFKLSRFEHLKYQQIADTLEISIKTVETQMSKALQHLRERLKEYLPIMLILLYLFKK